MQAPADYLLSLQDESNYHIMQSFFDDVASDLHAYYDQVVAVVRVVKLVFILIIVLLVLQILGLQGIAAAIWGTAGIGAFIIGFALKDIFEHFLAGFLLAFNRPFRIGDTVELDGEKGTVVALNMRNTHIKSFDGQDIYIPNGNIIKNALHNYTIDGFLRFDFIIPIEFGADIEKAVYLILKELGNIHGILTDGKKPFITLGDLGSRSINLGVFYWVDLFDEGVDVAKLKLDAVKNVVRALEEAGYYIPGDSIEVQQRNQA